MGLIRIFSQLSFKQIVPCLLSAYIIYVLNDTLLLHFNLNTMNGKSHVLTKITVNSKRLAILALKILSIENRESANIRSR